MNNDLSDNTAGMSEQGTDHKKLESYYFNDLQGDFYDAKYYRLRDHEEESAIVYSDDSDKRLFSYIIKDFFRVRRILEVGCAMGYLVKQLIAFGIDAYGIDFSHYCIEHASRDIATRVRHADLMKLPFPDTSFDMVIGLDILEHIPPSLLMTSLKSIYRVLKPGGIYFGVIPAYGENKYGPMVFDYRQRESWHNDALAGRPFRDIPLDLEGKPHMGHLIHATVDWWEQQFSHAGFERLGEIERVIHRIYDVYLDRGRWGIFVFQKMKRSVLQTILFKRHPYVDEWQLIELPYRPQGFFNWELWGQEGWTRWTGMNATELLRRHGRTVIIPFLVDHPDCSELNPVIVNFCFNNDSIVSFTVTHRGWRLARFPWKPARTRRGILHISVSRTFVPAAYSDCQDKRELGIALRPIQQTRA